MIKGQIELAQWWSKFKNGLNGQQRNKLESFKSLVLQYNPRLKMIAHSTESEFDLAHTAEGALLADVLVDFQSNWSIIDIGPGCGVPGIIMSILFEHWKIRLIERAEMRTAFLRTVVQELGLQNITLQTTDISPADIAETQCNLLTHRATLAPEAWIKLLSRLLPADGAFAGYATQKTHKEIVDILKPTGRKLTKIQWYQSTNAAIRCVYLSTPE